ncbi:MAG: PD-(D/E)XK nuclease family protein [Chromatiales bacterium]|nr:PD-(D/E)XK nuclease family protein [Chromatiales bacterium]
MTRTTTLITSRLARQHAVLDAALRATHGRQVLTPAQLAARLAGGFLQSIDRESLQAAARDVLADPALDLGDLASIRDLPGTGRALAATLQRGWVAGVDLAGRARDDAPARLVTLARIEQAVLARIPPGQRRPADLVAAALARLSGAPAVLGPVTVVGVPDLDPVWRPLLLALADVVPVTWQLGPTQDPGWAAASAVRFERAPAAAPTVLRVACANPRHEAQEALRWARELLAGGRAKPQDIAIAAPATAEWDDHLAAMAADGSLPLVFVHGRPALATRDGQAAAALAEVLLAGLGQARVRRLLGLVRGMTPATEALPDDWQRVLPRDAPLLTVARWDEAIAAVGAWPGGVDFGATLKALVALLARGAAAAEDVGEALLSGRALALWRRALREGPAVALDVTLTTLRVPDERDPVTAIVWCTAAEAAAAPRPFMRLLGLTSRGWPRTQGEDPLLPDHVLASAELNPVPVPERDRRDFRTLLKATAGELVLSRSRRDAEGRQHGASALLREAITAEAEQHRRREAVPLHALSEADRVLARPDEFARLPRARAALECWRDWQRPVLTPHDGLVRANHPLLARVLARRFSASRLRRLVRDPLGFVWQYAFRWEAPAEADEPLELDALQFGNLLHRVLELAVERLGPAGGLVAEPPAIEQVLGDCLADAAAECERAGPVPPRLIWRRTLEEVRGHATRALFRDEPPLPGQRSWGEVPFGGDSDGAGPQGPWDATQPVVIPGTTLAIGGFIDRLDLSADGTRARVTDYKTGKPPKPKDIPTLGGGGELQRCLYASAVRVLLGQHVAVEARLLYTAPDGGLLPLEDPAGQLDILARYLQVAHGQLRAGNAVPGPDSGQYLDGDLTFALPGNAADLYLERKLRAAVERLAPLPELWALR